MNLINEAEIRETWAPIIESATGISSPEKLAWMSQYCHNHKLYEDANIMSLDPVMNLRGMGATAFPSTFATSGGTGLTGSSDGSGDKSPTLLPLAMQVAAQTIGLDLVPVVPMAGPMGLLSYLDFVYEGGRVDNRVTPTYVKASGTGLALADIDSVTAGTQVGAVLVGTSRIDGKNIYRVNDDGETYVSNTAGKTVADLFTVTSGSVTVELVKALEDHIPGMTGANDAGDPYTREAGERTPDKVMGLQLFSKSVSAETFQISAAVTREQVQDLKQFGVDAVAQVESVLTNELTQSLNDLILRRLRSLGTTNITRTFGSATGFDITLAANSALTGGETVFGEHRKILTQILAAANLIANRGRRGAGNFTVVGPQVATVLQSVSGFVANPMANTFSQVAGAIYPVGSVAGINVYTDPRLAWSDYSVLVGRKGDGNGPGVVFMPYLMAESVQAIVEGTMAPKIAVKSRFALVDAGFHPETQYVEFDIKGSWTNLITLS